jgi:hypothetical protein
MHVAVDQPRNDPPPLEILLEEFERPIQRRHIAPDPHHRLPRHEQVPFTLWGWIVQLRIPQQRQHRATPSSKLERPLLARGTPDDPSITRA